MAKREVRTTDLTKHAFHKRHYDELAKTLGSTVPGHPMDARDCEARRANHRAEFEQWEKDVKAIVKMCVQDGNPAFNMDRFLAAVHREANK